MSFAQDVFHHLDEIDASELQRGNVDGNGQARPGFAINASAAQNPISEVDDQSAMLGDGDEFAWGDFTAGRMCPAAERLDTDNRLAAFVHNGLIQKLQAV